MPPSPLGYVGVKPLFLLRSWWEIVLNDYSKGALEALAWVQQLVKKLKRDPDGWVRLEGEMEAAKNDMLNGIGVDFRDRLRLGV